VSMEYSMRCEWRSMRSSRSLVAIQIAPLEAGVGIDTPIAKKRPIASGCLSLPQFQLGYQYSLRFAGFGKNDSKWITDEGMPPELDTAAVRSFMAHTVGGDN